MAEEYCVFLGEESAIAALEKSHFAIKSFEYSSGVRVVPYTSRLHKALCCEYGENPPGGYLKGSNSLCGAVADLLENASVNGKVAYIFEEHFGGWRDCESILWENGELIFGPSLEHTDQIKVLGQMHITKEAIYYFKKYDDPDGWLRESC